MNVMNEQLRRLMRSADRPDVSLQIRAPDGPVTVRGELFTIVRFGPDGNVALQAMLSTGRPDKDLSLGDGKEPRPHVVAPQMLAMTSPHPGWREELTATTAESHWSGGQREP